MIVLFRNRDIAGQGRLVRMAVIPGGLSSRAGVSAGKSGCGIAIPVASQAGPGVPGYGPDRVPNRNSAKSSGKNHVQPKEFLALRPECGKKPNLWGSRQG
jgi:hypothetical protein